MILAGIAVGNINNGHLVRGLPASWSKELRAIALALIFLRSGLELDLRVSALQLPMPRIQETLMFVHPFLSMICGYVHCAGVLTTQDTPIADVRSAFRSASSM